MKLFVQTFSCALTLTPMAAFPARVEASPNAHAILREFNKVVSSNGIDEAKANEIGGIRPRTVIHWRMPPISIATASPLPLEATTSLNSRSSAYAIAEDPTLA